MLQLRIYILLILCGEVFMLLKKNYQARFLSLTSLGRTDYIDFNHIRSVGRERYLNGTVEFKKDLGDDLYSVSIECFNDPNGDGEYKQLPLLVPRQPICKVIKSYWKYIEPSLKYRVNTDFPGHLGPCPIPKGLYYAKNLTANTDNWPATMQRGFFKAVVTLYDGNKVAGIVQLSTIISDLS